MVVGARTEEAWAETRAGTGADGTDGTVRLKLSRRHFLGLL